MPYYRIKLWTKLRKKPFEGIRWVYNPSVENVYRMYETNAKLKYNYDFIDIEVQQLSKLCTAVKVYLDSLEKQKKTMYVSYKGESEHKGMRG